MKVTITVTDSNGNIYIAVAESANFIFTNIEVGVNKKNKEVQRITKKFINKLN